MKGKNVLYGLGLGFLGYVFFSNIKQNSYNKELYQDKFEDISTDLRENMKLKANLENKAKAIKNQLKSIESQMNNINKKLHK